MTDTKPPRLNPEAQKAHDEAKAKYRETEAVVQGFAKRDAEFAGFPVGAIEKSRAERATDIKAQIATLQSELQELEQFRYRECTYRGRRMVLRDDGCRIEFRLPDGADTLGIEPDEWIVWAEYKFCDAPGVAAVIADLLMKPSDP